ncbi:hypothetical protein QNA23_11170 [Rhodococcus erythropolis]|uniref:Acb2/Tad1 domain-containing protein n=1 Tax=Rhodococcus erythropolis TaxID=1833 RepID=UPI0024BA667E|nr:hypothetical protein [Rhodococcus erythropolis]MDJ0404043.1 hypothetical protein [Rhodococcus erythropolis]
MTAHTVPLHEEIDNRFAYHPPTPEKVTQHETVRAECRSLAHTLVDLLPPGRDKAIALTKLEEVMYAANAAIARSGS